MAPPVEGQFEAPLQRIWALASPAEKHEPQGVEVEPWESAQESSENTDTEKLASVPETFAEPETPQSENAWQAPSAARVEEPWQLAQGQIVTLADVPIYQ